MQQLEFTQVSGANANATGYAWNETVTYTDAGGTHTYDQIEFNVFRSTNIFHQVIPFANGNIENIRLGTFSDPNVSGTDYFVLAFGDDSGTTIREYSVRTGAVTTVTQVANIWDPATGPQKAFSNMTVLGGGRVALTYDDVLAPDQTSQLDFKIFDLRTTGDVFNGQVNPTGHDDYIAGTQFSDAVVGENNVNNTYYYIGQDSTSQWPQTAPPSDTFTGGNNGWNVAILTGPRSNYTITTSNGTTVITKSGDPHHVGSLTVSNVQELVFNPSMDPGGNSGKLIEVFGGSTVDLLAPVPGGGEVVKVDSGATLESDVIFSDATGTLRLEPQSTFTGHVVGFIEGDRIDLIGFDPNSTHTSFAGDATGGTLTVADATHTVAGHTAAQILLAGNYLSSTFSASDDGHGGAFIVDPPSSPLVDTASTISVRDFGVGSDTINSGTALELAGASAADVLFANTSGQSGTLVLDNSVSFAGQITGFAGDGTVLNSDSIDLKDINFATATDTYAAGVLSVSDGVDVANIRFSGSYELGNFVLSSDGHGGTLVVDPPTATNDPFIQNQSTDSLKPVTPHDAGHVHIESSSENGGAQEQDIPAHWITDRTRSSW